MTNGRSRPSSSLFSVDSDSSLFVLLDHVGRPGVRLVRILAELAQRAPLAEQIPALIELDLQLVQPYLVVAAQVAALIEPLLLADEILDALEDCRVVLGSHSLAPPGPRMVPFRPRSLQARPEGRGYLPAGGVWLP